MAELNRRAMLGLAGAAMAGSLAACSEASSTVAASPGNQTPLCQQGHPYMTGAQMVVDGGKTAHAG